MKYLKIAEIRFKIDEVLRKIRHTRLWSINSHETAMFCRDRSEFSGYNRNFVLYEMVYSLMHGYVRGYETAHLGHGLIVKILFYNIITFQIEFYRHIDSWYGKQTMIKEILLFINLLHSSTKFKKIRDDDWSSLKNSIKYRNK